ncbi:ABC transporter permease [Methanocella sp. CWC-04]|uniref:ABC transporter permease n=1 Tax=Methanooceanicella nereidis TaxID=2052831 RepID=A0AAP2W4F9_9EURY|nr:ABC transporter permease subunit [Methanocella sp. CWC-04]MCD1293398.1 ABC transporter permease [Methanocella sp. CWC-04]
MNKIKIIMEKEFDEFLKNKLLLGSTILIPLLFVVIASGLLLGVTYFPDLNNQDDLQMYLKLLPNASEMSAQEVMLMIFSKGLLTFFMMIPAIIPMMISSYSIIGEKKNRTLEPLLAAPISVYDILIGKTLASIIPALIMTYVAATLFIIVVTVGTYSIVNKFLFLDPMWFIGLFVLAPLLAFMGVLLTIIISSRVNDPRSAQQISVVIILPIMGLFISQMTGLFLLDIKIIAIVTAVALLADIGILVLGKELFDREEILTRWT